jgi:maltooligosyltrehalose trehalohydrolase
MASFRVWAPNAERVEIEVGGDRLPMRAVDGGWYETDVDWAAPGTEYRYVLDGRDLLPDPRSPAQPSGIDGPSQVIDVGAFPWTDQHWRGINLPSAVIYEMHIGTFTEDGTFEAAIDKLDHLVDLGVTAVELLPVAEFSGDRGWGYDGVLLYAPHHAYGGPHGLMRLVDACHARGLAVIIDVVYNHLGPAGNHLAKFGPYFTDRYNTPWGDAVNLDGPGSDDVRAFFIDNALMWLTDYHFDGLRLDAVHAIVDTSAYHLLEELSIRVEQRAAALGRNLFLIAESDLNDPRIVRSRDIGGYGMNAQWSDDFHHALHAVLTGETSGYYSDFGKLSQLAYALEHVFVYDGRLAPHRGRWHGRPATGLPGWKFLGYLQDHDQVGNRAVGERSAALMSTGRLKIGAALVLLSPFVPMLFMGEEWGASTPFQYFTDHQDPELGRAVSEGRRSEFSSFGWKPDDVPDPQDEATFLRSKLDWDELGAPVHRELLEWHTALIALRRSERALTNGDRERVRVAYDEHARWLTLRRGAISVAVNLADSDRTVAVTGTELLLVSDPGVSLGEGAVRLPSDSVAVVKG